jgi:hypothetical protein
VTDPEPTPTTPTTEPEAPAPDPTEPTTPPTTEKPPKPPKDEETDPIIDLPLDLGGLLGPADPVGSLVG